MSDPEIMDGAARDLVDDYVRTVRRRLRGAGSAAVADELRDHLYEAVQASTEGSEHTHVGAALRIIAEFGHPSRIARAFQDGLHARRALSVAFRALTAAIVISSVWLMILLTGPYAPWTERSEPFGPALADVVGSISMAMTLAAGIAALLLGVVARGRRGVAWSVGAAECATRLSRLGTGTLAMSVASILGYVLVRGYLAPRSLEWSDVWIGLGVTSLAVLALVVGHLSDRGSAGADR